MIVKIATGTWSSSISTINRSVARKHVAIDGWSDARTRSGGGSRVTTEHADLGAELGTTQGDHVLARQPSVIHRCR